MDHHEALRLTRREPFEPFRVKTTDSRGYDVLHRRLVMVGFRGLHVGIPRLGLPDGPVFETSVSLDYSQIARAEPLAGDG